MTRAILLMLTLMAGWSSSVDASMRAIHGAPNAEDMAPTLDGRWVFAGSGIGGPVTSGAIMLINARTGQIRRAYIPSGRSSNDAGGPCRAEAPAENFSPHGIALSPRGDTLYVINHGGRESIEILRIMKSRIPRLEWAGCILAPKDYYLNSVAVARDGTIFTTNWPLPLDIKKFADLSGSVFSWKAGTWKQVANSGVTTPNGLLVTPDGKTLYVSAYARQEIVEINIEAAGTARRTLKTTFMPDNLR